MEATSDALLVTAARGGDGAAYGELFARHQSRIYNYAYGIAGNRDDAADIAQEAFVRVFEALPRLTGELNFSAYMYRTTHNIAIDTVKGRGRFEAPEALDMQVEPSLRTDPERIALVQEQQHQAWQAAFQLSDDHRAILTLRELHDLSYQEIAEIMDMPRNTVGVLLSRARLRFKEAFRMSSVDIDRLTAECRDMLPLLSAYLDDELDEKKRARVESHLEQCAFCRLALEEMTESSRSYRAILPLLPPAVLGEGLWHRLGDLAAPARPTSSSGLAGAKDGFGETTSSDASKPKSGRRCLRPRVLALVAGGAVVLLGALAATGILDGRGGSGADGTVAGDVTRAGLAAEALATITTAPPAPSTSTVTTLGASTAPPITIVTSTTPSTAAGLTTDTTTAPTPGASVVTGSTAETPAAGTGSEGIGPDPSSSTVTEARDTTAPPTPGIIYPASGEVVKGSTITLQWKPVPDSSGVTYRVEVESLDQKAGAYVLSRSVDGIKGDRLPHVMASAVERWRVTAIDGAGNASKPSAWAKFAQSTVDVPTVKPTIPTPMVPNLPGATITVPSSTTTSTTTLY